MPGGVAGAPPIMEAPYADWPISCPGLCPSVFGLPSKCPLGAVCPDAPSGLIGAAPADVTPSLAE
jgi:hypothetical protein